MSIRTISALVLISTFILFSCTSKKQVAVSSSFVEHQEHSKKSMKYESDYHKQAESRNDQIVQYGSYSSPEKVSYRNEPVNTPAKISRENHSKSKIQKRVEKFTKSIKSIKEKQVDKGDRVGKGLAFVLVGLAFLGLGLLFNSLLGVFGVVLLLIFGIAAAILILMGLVIMVTK